MPMISERVIINKIDRYLNDKDGKPLKSQYGKPYQKVRIGTEQHEERLIWGNDYTGETRNWQLGSEVELVITENQGYLNFRLPKRDDVIDAKLDQILDGIEAIQENLSKRP